MNKFQWALLWICCLCIISTDLICSPEMSLGLEVLRKKERKKQNRPIVTNVISAGILVS